MSSTEPIIQDPYPWSLLGLLLMAGCESIYAVGRKRDTASLKSTTRMLRRGRVSSSITPWRRTTKRSSGSAPTSRHRKSRTRITRSGSTPGRVLEHWHSGTMTRRVPQLQRAMPASLCRDQPRGRDALGIRTGDKVRLETRRGSLELSAWIDGRGKCPKGHVFVPFFDETKLINRLTLDAHCRSASSRTTRSVRCAS